MRMNNVNQNTITNLTDSSSSLLVGCSQFRGIPDSWGVTEKMDEVEEDEKRPRFMYLSFNIRRLSRPNNKPSASLSTTYLSSLWIKTKPKTNNMSYQWVGELRCVIISVCDGDGGSGSSCQSNLTSCHVFRHNLQLVLCGGQRLQKDIIHNYCFSQVTRQMWTHFARCLEEAQS